jgi:plastocyanin
MSPPPSRVWSSIPLAIVLLLAVVVPYGGIDSVGAVPALTDASGAGANVTIDVSATSQLSFVPNSFSVAPGETVHLVVTQLADFNHTFTLSPIANATVPATDSAGQVALYFNAHAPLVNLSLGDVSGARFYANFSAPAQLGSYEYLCLIHFPAMTGTMVVSNDGPGPSGGLTLDQYAATGGIALLVVIGLFAVFYRRKPVPPADPSSTPRP